jgi:hypothetical protein
MVALVELEEVKARLNFDEDLDHHDADLEALIGAASEAVLNYLKLEHDHYDATDAEDVPEIVKTAIIMLVGALKRDPSAKDSEKWSDAYLPRPVMALLYPLRSPALA